MPCETIFQCLKVLALKIDAHGVEQYLNNIDKSKALDPLDPSDPISRTQHYDPWWMAPSEPLLTTEGILLSRFNKTRFRV